MGQMKTDVMLASGHAHGTNTSFVEAKLTTNMYSFTLDIRTFPVQVHALIVKLVFSCVPLSCRNHREWWVEKPGDGLHAPRVDGEGVHVAIAAVPTISCYKDEISMRVYGESAHVATAVVQTFRVAMTMRESA
jgi:hypothetical protein